MAETSIECSQIATKSAHESVTCRASPWSLVDALYLDSLILSSLRSLKVRILGRGENLTLETAMKTECNDGGD